MAKVGWHQGELYPRVGFIVTNLPRPPARVVKFYNGRTVPAQKILWMNPLQVLPFALFAKTMAMSKL
jgi:hypothetical protein